MKVFGNPKIVKELTFQSASGKDEITIRTGDLVRIITKAHGQIEGTIYEGRLADVSYDEHVYAGEEGFEDGIVIQYLTEGGDPLPESELGDDDGYEAISFDSIEEIERL